MLETATICSGFPLAISLCICNPGILLLMMSAVQYNFRHDCYDAICSALNYARRKPLAFIYHGPKGSLWTWHELPHPDPFEIVQFHISLSAVRSCRTVDESADIAALTIAQSNSAVVRMTVSRCRCLITHRVRVCVYSPARIAGVHMQYGCEKRQKRAWASKALNAAPTLNWAILFMWYVRRSRSNSILVYFCKFPACKAYYSDVALFMRFCVHTSVYFSPSVQ